MVLTKTGQNPHDTNPLIFLCSKVLNNGHTTVKFVNAPVMGIPEKPCLAFAAKTSPTQFSGLRTNGSRMKPCSNFLTFLTSLAWNSTEQL